MTDASIPARETANERFKRRSMSWFWVGIILATGAHFALFLTTPSFAVEDITYGARDLDVVEVPDEIEIPAPPEAVARPATPVIADAVVETDLTIAPTTFEENPVESLPPPPGRASAAELAAAPTFTPMTVRPRLKNPDEVARLLQACYPKLLRDAGIGGTVHVWFFIDETGCVQRTLVHETSGYDAFDQAAIQVADAMEFSPAYNRDRPVPVWVSLAIEFEAASIR